MIDFEESEKYEPFTGTIQFIVKSPGVGILGTIYKDAGCHFFQPAPNTDLYPDEMGMIAEKMEELDKS
jgi:hypothetical protein